ncbi:MAG: gluconate 2-dehydrogenase subunit 3 family protein [Gemmatimonadales bacterium]
MTDNDIAVLDTPEMITRREAVLRVSALLGGVALIGGSAWITGCRTEKSTNSGEAFTNDDVSYLDEIAETILPATSTPGAKAAKTGAFMALMVRDTYSPEDEKIFRDGMRKLDQASKDKNGGKSFMEAMPEQRLALLQTLDKEQFDYSVKRKAEAKRKSEEFLAEKQQSPQTTQSAKATQIVDEPPNRYFRMMKELALLGYFTSEIGMTQAQRYVESPGRYDPCIPYDGKPSWAGHA